MNTTITTKSEVIDQVVYPLARQAGWLVAVDTDTLDEALSDIFDALEDAGLIQTVWGEGWTLSDDLEQAAAISEVIIDTLMATEVRAVFRKAGATLRADGDRWAIKPDERHRWDAEGIPPKATLRALSLDEALDLLPVLVTDRVDVYEDNAGGIVLQRGYLAYAGWDLPAGQGVEDARAWLSGEWSPEGDLQQTTQASWATRETKRIASITADAVELHDEPGAAGAAYLGIEA